MTSRVGRRARGLISSTVVVMTVSSFVIASSPPSEATEVNVAMSDNFFSPQEIRIEPGDTVVWQNQGFRRHTVTSDKGLFDSGLRDRNEAFSRTFRSEGTFVYHCRLHGEKGRVGMWGVVIVGDEAPAPDQPSSDQLVVPDDFSTIQVAVDAASPGATIVARPGTYREEVTVATPRLTIRGMDRFRTVLDGGDSQATGVTVKASGVSVKNLTVRNYTGAGILIDSADRYTVQRVDVIKNRTYGVHAADSQDGVIRNVFAWGSGDSGIGVSSCADCGTLVEGLYAAYNFLGYSGVNATGVVVRDSTWTNNGVGIAAGSWGGTSSMLSRGTFIFNNVVGSNNYRSVPAAGMSAEYGIPFGTGIWLAGASYGIVQENEIFDHERYGVLITDSIDDSEIISRDNSVILNAVLGSQRFDLAWDGSGPNNCFSSNEISGATGPPELQTRYACEQRPFEGTTYAPVNDDVDVAVRHDVDREQSEPPEPQRPSCQRSAPGCS